MPEDRVILANTFMVEWQKALGLEGEKVYRLVIDATVGEPLKVYVSKFGTDRLLDVKPPAAEGVEITVI